MKSLFDEMPKLIDLTLKKVAEVKSPVERPEAAEARAKLIRNVRLIGKEFAFLSSKYGAEPQPQKHKRIPAVLADEEEKKEDKQLSFDFIK